MNRFFLSRLMFVIPLLMISCGSPKSKQPSDISSQDSLRMEQAALPFLDLADLISKKRDVLLSELAVRITYIPLETPRSFMIGEKNVHVKPCGEYIFVSEHGKPVGAFDRTGKFIRKIGNIGKGPGEYNFDFIFWPDEASRQVYIWNADKGTIMAYSFEGAFLKDIKPEFRLGNFVPVGNGLFLSWTFMQADFEGKFYRMVFHDNIGKTKSRVFESKKKYDFSHGISIMTPLLTRAPEGWLYNSWENDTIFRIKADSSFTPAFSWKSGKLRIPIDGMKDYSRFLREKDNYLMDLNAIESPSKWFIRYDYQGRNNLAVYDKRSAEFFVVANADTAQRGIINDIDGGPSFFPLWDNENGRYFVRLINAIDLLDYQNGKAKNTIEPKDPAAARKFREMVATLTDNSNPVVMLVELK